MNAFKDVDIKIGTPATIYVGSDSYALTVIWISPSRKTIKLKYKSAGLARDVITARKLRDKTAWQALKGRKNSVNSSVIFGKAVDYRDPNF